MDVKVQLIEGYIQKVNPDGTQRLRPDYHIFRVGNLESEPRVFRELSDITELYMGYCYARGMTPFDGESHRLDPQAMALYDQYIYTEGVILQQELSMPYMKNLIQRYLNSLYGQDIVVSNVAPKPATGYTAGSAPAGTQVPAVQSTPRSEVVPRTAPPPSQSSSSSSNVFGRIFKKKKNSTIIRPSDD